jgi:thiol-disulfide isomerase/thioredoxin
MPRTLRYLLYTVMLLCCVVIGFSVYLQTSGREAGLQEPEAAVVPATLSEFTLNDVWGDPRAISEWSGQPLLINFWATWCAPCRREMPLLQTLHNERASTGLTILGIAIDRQADVQAYVTEAGITYPILVGEADAMAVSDQFGLPDLGLPFSVLVAGDGSILTVHVGEINLAQLRELVDVSAAVAGGELTVAQARERLDSLRE